MNNKQYKYNLYRINTPYGNNQFVVAKNIPTASTMFKENYKYEPNGVELVSEYVMIPEAADE